MSFLPPTIHKHVNNSCMTTFAKPLSKSLYQTQIPSQTFFNFTQPSSIFSTTYSITHDPHSSYPSPFISSSFIIIKPNSLITLHHPFHQWKPTPFIPTSPHPSYLPNPRTASNTSPFLHDTPNSSIRRPPR